jgi:hypothetical protein
LIALFNNSKGEHIVRFYDGYLSKQECEYSFTYDSSWIFNGFSDFYNDIKKESRKYVNKIHTQDIRILILESLCKFNIFLEQMAYQSLKEFERSNDFKSIIKNKNLNVYMENLNLDTNSNIKIIPLYVFDIKEKKSYDIEKVCTGKT